MYENISIQAWILKGPYKLLAMKYSAFSFLNSISCAEIANKALYNEEKKLEVERDQTAAIVVIGDVVQHTLLNTMPIHEYFKGLTSQFMKCPFCSVHDPLGMFECCVLSIAEARGY